MFYLELIALCFIALLLYNSSSSNSLKYYLKFFVYYGVVIFNSLLLLPYLLLHPTNVMNLITASKFCNPISRIIGLTWTLRGAKNLQKDETCVIVANHQSSLDVLGMFDIWPVMNRTTVVAKRELLFIWPFGISAWLCGLIFINRYKADSAKNTMNNAMDKLKREKIKLFVFPEGTRRNTGIIHDFKKGAFNVAIKAQVPIIPIVFSSYQPFLDDSNRILNSGEIIIEALPEISTKNLNEADVTQLMEETRQLMIDKYVEITKEIQMKTQNSLVSGSHCIGNKSMH